ncbi:MAG: polysaccharide deacetylase family protein [Elusimicrobia bacterium]|nr:polysaccharide deacetylase family protein [Elusimicrobiota bacterium]
MLIAVNYHYIRPRFDAPHPGIHGVTPEEFRSRLELLSRAGEFIGLGRLRAAVSGGAGLPERAILVTFDDGLREQFDHARPVLQDMGIPAAFFVNPAPLERGTVMLVHKIHILRSSMKPDEFIKKIEEGARAHDGGSNPLPKERQHLAAGAARLYPYDDPTSAQTKYLLNILLPRPLVARIIDELFAERFKGEEAALSRGLYMDRARLETLAAGDCLGSHAYDHVPLGLLSREEADLQISSSLERLEALSGARPYALSYPYGSREACAGPAPGSARRAGVELAFTMERAGNPSLEDPLFLARFDGNDMPGGKSCSWPAEELFERIPRRSWKSA